MAKIGTHSTEEARAYLQTRLALLSKAMFIIGFLGLIIHVFTIAEGTTTAAHILMFTNPLIALTVWQVCRRGRHSEGMLSAIEFGGLLASTFCISALGRFMLPVFLGQLNVDPADPTQIHMLGMIQAFMSMSIVLEQALTLVMRAAIVPSSPRRTLVITLILGLPIVLIGAFGFPPFEGPEPFRAHTGPEQIIQNLVNGFIWWCIVTVTCVLTTHIIHGLRREVREALALGQYTLESQIGEGGMGVVYRATHGMMRRPTAIKLLSPSKAGADNLKRFEQEARLTARLTHPNTVTIYDYGRTPDGLFYYAMELLDGADLEAIVGAAGPLTVPRTLKVLAEVAEALEEAHGIGLIHRDIKPGNVMLCAYGGRADVAKLVDFGLVKELEHTDGAQITRQDSVVGTPQYLAPEGITAPETVDARSDIYALGAVGYFLLTGTHVFEGRTLMEVLGHHMHTAPAPLTQRLGKPLPEDIQAVLLACLSKSPEDRPQSAADCVARLRACAGYGEWSQDAARAWWLIHAEALTSDEKAIESDASARTVAIDRRHRARASSGPRG